MVGSPFPRDRCKVDAMKPVATHRGSACVLVVDDNAISRKIAVALLQSLGYDADVAIDGREAIDAVAERHYDAVLMDCYMPHMDGFTATAEIRRRETDHRTPIVACSVSARAVERGRAAGMDDALDKPIDLRKLSDVMRRWTSPAIA